MAGVVDRAATSLDPDSRIRQPGRLGPSHPLRARFPARSSSIRPDESQRASNPASRMNSEPVIARARG